jgi:hypothetical protein
VRRPDMMQTCPRTLHRGEHANIYIYIYEYMNIYVYIKCRQCYVTVGSYKKLWPRQSKSNGRTDGRSHSKVFMGCVLLFKNSGVHPISRFEYNLFLRNTRHCTPQVLVGVYGQTDGRTDGQWDRQTSRQAGRHTGSQSVRQTGRQTGM